MGGKDDRPYYHRLKRKKIACIAYCLTGVFLLVAILILFYDFRLMYVHIQISVDTKMD